MKWKKFLETPFLFAFLAIIFGIIFIKVIPPFWGVDEIVHFDRAYQVSTGNLLEDKLSGDSYGGLLPSDTVKMQTYVFKDLLDNKTEHEVDSRAVYDNYTKAHPSRKLEDYSFTSSGGYSPVAYAPGAAGIFIARTFHGTNGDIIFMARFMTLVVYICFVLAALWLLRNSWAQWMVFLVGLLPMSLFQASIVNVDSLVIGLSLLLFALLFNAWGRNKPLSYKYIGLLFIVGSWLSLTKPNYFLLTALIFFLPSKVLPLAGRVVWRIGLVAIPLTMMLTWSRIAKPVLHSALVTQKGPEVSKLISTSGQFNNVSHHPVGFVGTIVRSAVHNQWFDTMIGMLGYNFVLIPGFVIAMVAFCLGLSAFYRPPRSRDASSTTMPYLMLASALLIIVSIIGAFYFQYSVVGARTIEGIQGRYFVPLLPFVLVAIGRMIPIRVQMSSRLAALLFSGVMSFSLIVSLVYYHFITY